MIDKIAIRDKFSNALTSNVWKKLKEALLGRELIYYATELLYQNSLVMEALTNPLFLSKANVDQLKAATFLYNAAVDNYSPAFVKIRIKHQPTTETIYAPFNIRLTVGSYVFTNVDFVSDNNEIILYQGVVSTTTSFNRSGDAQNLAPLNTDRTVVWNQYSEPGSESVYSTYVKLGKEACCKSIRVFYRGEKSMPYTRYQDSLVSETAPLFKVTLGRDDSINVVFGDGVWGRPFDTSKDFQIFWLDYSINNFNLTEGLKVELNGAVRYLYLDKDKFSSAPIGSVYAVSYAQGYEADENYYRSQLQAVLSEQGLIVSKSQLKNYVNSFMSVLDCNPVVSGQNEVTVYVKPTDINDIYFSFIEEALSRIGEVCVHYKVRAADYYKYDIVLNTSEPITLYEKQQIKTEIEQRFSYENTKFNEVITSQYLAELASTVSSVRVYCSVQITEQVKDNKLLLLPVRDTIKVQDVEGTIIGWDSRSELIGPSSTVADFSGDAKRIFNTFVVTENNDIISPIEQLSRESTFDFQGELIKGTNYLIIRYATDLYHPRCFPITSFDSVSDIASMDTLIPSKIIDISRLNISGYSFRDHYLIGNRWYHTYKSNNTGNPIIIQRLVVPNTTHEELINDRWTLVTTAALDPQYTGVVTYSGTYQNSEIYNMDPFIVVRVTTSTEVNFAVLSEQNGTTAVEVYEYVRLLIPGSQLFTGTNPQLVEDPIAKVFYYHDDNETYLLQDPIVEVSKSYVLFSSAIMVDQGVALKQVRFVNDQILGITNDNELVKFSLQDKVYKPETLEIHKLEPIGLVDYNSGYITGVTNYFVSYEAATTMLSASESRYPVLNEVKWS